MIAARCFLTFARRVGGTREVAVRGGESEQHVVREFERPSRLVDFAVLDLCLQRHEYAAEQQRCHEQYDRELEQAESVRDSPCRCLHDVHFPSCAITAAQAALPGALAQAPVASAPAADVQLQPDALARAAWHTPRMPPPGSAQGALSISTRATAAHPTPAPAIP